MKLEVRNKQYEIADNFGDPIMELWQIQLSGIIECPTLLHWDTQIQY